MKEYILNQKSYTSSSAKSITINYAFDYALFNKQTKVMLNKAVQIGFIIGFIILVLITLNK